MLSVMFNKKRVRGVPGDPPIQLKRIVKTHRTWAYKRKGLRVRETITSHFLIPPSGHLEPLFIRTILNVGPSTLAVVLPQIDPICPKSGRELWEVIVSRTLSRRKDCIGPSFTLGGKNRQGFRDYLLRLEEKSSSKHSRLLQERGFLSVPATPKDL